MRTGLGLTPPFDIPRPVEELFGVVKQVEEDGFSSVWAPSLPSVGPPDALVLLGALSRMTSRIELGSYVVPTFPRHPATLAQQALTIQQLSANRFTRLASAQPQAGYRNRLRPRLFAPDPPSA